MIDEFRAVPASRICWVSLAAKRLSSADTWMAMKGFASRHISTDELLPVDARVRGS